MVQSSPAIGQAGEVFFTSTLDSTLYKVDGRDGAVRWAAALGGSSFSSPALGRLGLYVGTNGGLLEGGGSLHAFVG